MPKPLDLAAAVASDLNRTNPLTDPDETHLEAFGADIVLPGPPTRTEKRDIDTDTPGRGKRKRSAVQVTVPSTVLAMLDSAAASHSVVLRAAFNNHADELVEELAPDGPMSLHPRRRVPPNNDPFEIVMFRMAAAELDLLDATTAKAVVTRSLFVTELLRRELSR